MNPKLKNILALFAGLVVGSIVNMGIIFLSGSIIPPPEGADLTTQEGLTAAMPLMQPIHFLMPFLAHALGTMVGAVVAAWLAASQPFKYALMVGGFFFVGGIMNVMMLPVPMWFSALDLIAAYFPFAYLGWKIVEKFKFVK